MSTNVGVGKKKKKRIVYLDYLRALAIITVMLFHIYNRLGIYVAPEVLGPSLSWLMVDFYGTCCRCGVDIFLMLSGALSLGRDWDIKSFLGKGFRELQRRTFSGPVCLSSVCFWLLPCILT